MHKGSIEDTVDRIRLWCRLTPRGLALAEFQSEPARQRVVAALRASLPEEAGPLHELSLAPASVAVEVVHRLVDELGTLDGGVVSLDGFGPLFPPGRPPADLVSVFNFNRERLAAPPLKQIWWMPPHVLEAFRHGARDLYSWFRARWNLTEEVPPTERPELFTDFGKEPRPKDLADARGRAAYLTERFERALDELETPRHHIEQQLLRPAVRALREAGAEREARELESSLLQKLMRRRPPRVFISYSHDSAAHAERVLALADRLRGEGLDCMLDQYEPAPPEGWPRWMEKQLEATDFVLVVSTAGYLRSANGETSPGVGRGARFESVLLVKELYDAGMWNERFVPVLFGDARETNIIRPLRAYTYYVVDTEDGYEALYRRLTEQPSALKPELGEVKTLPPRDVARHSLPTSPWKIPYPRNPFFTGRKDALDSLRRQLGTAGKAVLGQTAAISGLGGIGKTQTAVEFAWRHREDYSRGVFFVRAANKGEIVDGFAEIAGLVGLKVGNDQTEAAAAVRRWLEETDGWLLILDNVDEPADVKPWLPPGHRGHVILTSRASTIAMLGIGQPIEMEALRPDESMDFLLARTGRVEAGTEEMHAVRELAQELGYLPLALEQAGAYVKAHEDRFTDYLASYRRRGLELLGRSMPEVEGHPDPVATTWSLNFEQVEDVSPAAADVLRASAFLDPDAIPEELLTEGGGELGPAVAATLKDSDPLAVGEILGPLLRYSLIKREARSRTWSVHRVVQAAVRASLGEMTKLWTDRVARSLEAVFPWPEFETWPRCERLVKHVLSAIPFAEDSSDLASLLNSTGWYLYLRGRQAEAEQSLTRSLRILEKMHLHEHPEVADVLLNLAALYAAQGLFAEAEPLCKRALRILGCVLDDQHPDIAKALNDLAALYVDQGRYSEAQPLYERALHIRQKVFGNEHPEVAMTLNNLASSYYFQGRFAEALTLYRHALLTMEQVLGDEHPNVAMVLNNLAALYAKQGQFDDAETLFKRVCRIRERVLGDEHPEFAYALRNLAALYANHRRWFDAEPLLVRSLCLLEKTFEPEHPQIQALREDIENLRRIK